MQAMLLTMNLSVITAFNTHFISCGLEKKRKHVFDYKWGKYDTYTDHQTLSELFVVHDLKFLFL